MSCDCRASCDACGTVPGPLRDVAVLWCLLCLPRVEAQRRLNNEDPATLDRYRQLTTRLLAELERRATW